jgi:hypothetical protein
MNMFPEELDGAKVLHFTDKADFGVLEEEGQRDRTISYLAIAQKSGDPAYYLILCDAAYAVIADHRFPAVEWCKTMAEMRYPDIVWNEME